MKPTIKKLTYACIDDILSIQASVYIPEYHEKKETFTNIIKVFPEGCLGISYKNILCGYIFFHPYFKELIKPLNHKLIVLGTENCIYLHDIAIHPDHQKKGYSKILLHEADKQTKKQKISLQSLVSVQNSLSFWQKNNFNLIHKVQYGKNQSAHYMEKYF